ncbi:dihydroneopterin aldolase [Spongiibacter sp. KMU-166]|uniref:7,8-dihydroneopterin aldolase n=1 Tax=Spongiibacter thalassae TaxID=2721624 RepID=A0ABX1GBS7_9GAMM|nr:dihydroneopterin aldolase [Spongiibacter thalassae]NKI16619.1 dihydroneopterin aldolase [Spongiibacter thalassae]
MDIVYVRGLRIDTLIGIHDFEREHRQTVVLDLELGYDIRAAAASEDITLTLDYQAISERLFDFVRASEFLLVETLAERCAELILREFSVPWLRLRLSKPGALHYADDVGIVIERGERSG